MAGEEHEGTDQPAAKDPVREEALAEKDKTIDDALAGKGVQLPSAQPGEHWLWRIAKWPFRAINLIPEWRESRLSSLLQEDDLEWAAEEREVKSLVAMLRAKHAQSRIDVHAANRLGTLAATIGGACLFMVAWIGHTAWRTLLDALKAGAKVDWHVLLATSGVILLTLGAATLALRVADRFYQRAVLHARDADATRKMEASIRIALVARRLEPHPREMLSNLAGKILTQGTSIADDKLDLSITPEIAREGVELAGKAMEPVAKVVATVKGSTA